MKKIHQIEQVTSSAETIADSANHIVAQGDQISRWPPWRRLIHRKWPQLPSSKPQRWKKLMPLQKCSRKWPKNCKHR
ncbi:hypothetical protein PP175_18775 [Aneurinibacillus sp. Ricciae_BoGa-3]|uniref:hypothetical protein n=1 Tax=Aneurinibacillus sp. Ricciae_BoGa-3 TaxID=3022697 RepID=UPI002341623A|nr:hypothetical protein [Aneurinibacillus sp. Ricciae_BoGa-3]WCK53379.1 hypothetical protein PP175_18775 [Aneurinibacillus sp. Ricciae_BoGa-3]